MVLLATDLKLSAVEVDDIQTAWPRKPAIQRLEMLKKWQEKYKLQATYRWLITALHRAHRTDVINTLHNIATIPPTEDIIQYITQSHKLAWYGDYLKGRHTQIHIAAASNKWLPSPTQKIFNLAIIKKEKVQHGRIDDEFVSKTIRGKVDDILLKKSPIELKYLFTNKVGERKVILVDGAPGSGKSTLTVHICQRWSRGKLFQEFTAVILVQLRDPAVQSAKNITDLIPCRDDTMSQEIAEAIKDIDGGVSCG